jgi:hypothetical protein
MYQWSSLKMPKAFVWNTVNCNKFGNLSMSQGLTFPNMVSSTDASSSWTVLPTSRSWLLLHRSWDANWFSKQSASTLAFSFGWYVIPKGPWSGLGAFGPSLTHSPIAPTVLLVTSRHWPHGKHISSFAASVCFRANMLVCQVVTQWRMLYSCIFRCRCPATGLHATTLYLTGKGVRWCTELLWLTTGYSGDILWTRWFLAFL